MSNESIAPLPPPLPKSIPMFEKSQDITFKNVTKNINNISESECSWAVNFPELKYASVRYNICRNSEPYCFKFDHYESLLQEGPTCGLVAISILLNHKILPSESLKIAKCNNYSNNGELFSVHWTALLIHQIIRELNFYTDIKIEIRKNLYSDVTIKELLAGCKILVPYDSDKNHYPCLKKGHKAHWAFITGIILTEPPSSDSKTYHPDSVYVTVKHGKSLHLGLWKLQDLDASNKNLLEFSPEREYDHLQYVLPGGGLDGENGLKNQFILIHPTISKLNDS